LGIFWNGQQAAVERFQPGAIGTLSWIHLAFLFAVSLMPFVLLVCWREYITYRSVLIAYWGNIFPCLAWCCLSAGGYATRAGLLQQEITTTGQCAVERRIVVAQALYAFGALAVPVQHLRKYCFHYFWSR